MAEVYKVANIKDPLYCWRLTKECISHAKAQEQKSFADQARTAAAARESKRTWGSNGETTTGTEWGKHPTPSPSI